MKENPVRVLKRINAYKDKVQSVYETTVEEEERENASDDLSLVDDLFSALANYTSSVFTDQDNRQNSEYIRKNSNSIKDYQDIMTKSDVTRKMHHDTLIRTMAMLDRLCGVYGTEPIYGEFGPYLKDTSMLTDKKNYSVPGVLEKRKEITSWATDLSVSCTAALSLDIEIDDIENTEDVCLFSQIGEQLKHMNIKRKLKEVSDISNHSTR